MHFSNPDLGYTDSSITVIHTETAAGYFEQQVYSVVIPPRLPWTDDGRGNLEKFLEETGSTGTTVPVTSFTRGPFTAECLMLNLSN